MPYLISFFLFCNLLNNVLLIIFIEKSAKLKTFCYLIIFYLSIFLGGDGGVSKHIYIYNFFLLDANSHVDKLSCSIC